MDRFIAVCGIFQAVIFVMAFVVLQDTRRKCQAAGSPCGTGIRWVISPCVICHHKKTGEGY